MFKQSAGRNGDTASTGARAPALVAIPFLKPSDGDGPVQLLSCEQREQLLQCAEVREFPARRIVYRAGAPADSVFVIAEGVIKSYRDLANGRRRIAAFFFPHDLFGLAEAGHYVNTVQTITAVRVYAISVEALTELFQREPDIETQFLVKIVHVLRQAQHHNIIVARRDAVGRFAMLLRLLREHCPARSGKDIALPMSRSDIADYLGLSLEAVSRASRRLERQGIIQFVQRNEVRIIDRPRFEAVAAAA